MTKQDNGLGNEFLESILSDWARNLWTLNNQERITDDASKRAVENEFHKKWFPDNNRGLTKAQSASEQGFTLFIYGLIYSVGLVSNKAVEAISDTKLVDAWRKAVWRNSFQQKYNTFETILKDALDKKGEEAVAAAFPKLYSDVKGDDIVATIDYYGYKEKNIAKDTVKYLIRKATKAQPPAPSQKNAPAP